MVCHCFLFRAEKVWLFKITQLSKVRLDFSVSWLLAESLNHCTKLLYIYWHKCTMYQKACSLALNKLTAIGTSWKEIYKPGSLEFLEFLVSKQMLGLKDSKYICAPLKVMILLGAGQEINMPFIFMIKYISNKAIIDFQSFINVKWFHLSFFFFK